MHLFQRKIGEKCYIETNVFITVVFNLKVFYIFSGKWAKATLSSSCTDLSSPRTCCSPPPTSFKSLAASLFPNFFRIRGPETEHSPKTLSPTRTILLLAESAVGLSAQRMHRIHSRSILIYDRQVSPLNGGICFSHYSILQRSHRTPSAPPPLLSPPPLRLVTGGRRRRKEGSAKKGSGGREKSGKSLSPFSARTHEQRTSSLTAWKSASFLSFRLDPRPPHSLSALTSSAGGQGGQIVAIEVQGRVARGISHPSCFCLSVKKPFL